VKQYAVSLTDDAKTDLQDIYDYIAEHDAPAKADGLLDKLEVLVESLDRFPERGAVTKELRDVGIKDYREVYFKPYRVIYRVLGTKVYVYLIVDGRRDMQTLLTRRLIRA
jgi:toxin ParE1/3/4